MISNTEGHCELLTQLLPYLLVFH